ncbi:hypothetical protein [Frankia sp. CiP1_Cm_nod1]
MDSVARQRRRRPGRLRARAWLPAAAAAVVIVGLAAVTAVVPPLSGWPAVAAPVSDQRPVFQVRVMELPAQVDRTVLDNLNSLLNGVPDGDGAVVVRVTGAAGLAGDQDRPAALDTIFDRRDRLVVQVALPDRSRTGAQPDLGTAGSLLLAVAGHRFADADSARAAFARNDSGGGQQAPCKKQCREQVAGTGTERESRMYATNTDPFVLDVTLRRVLQVDSSSTPFTGPGDSLLSERDDSGRSFWFYVLIVAVPLGLVAVLWRRGLSSRKGGGADNGPTTAAPRRHGPPSAAQQWLVRWRRLLGREDDGAGGGDNDEDDEDDGYGGRRPLSPVAQPNVGIGSFGVVHSAFDPQGYVEVDGGLYRATWKGGPGASRPRVGDQVLLRTHRVDGLQAWPPHGSPDR